MDNFTYEMLSLAPHHRSTCKYWLQMVRNSVICLKDAPCKRNVGNSFIQTVQ